MKKKATIVIVTICVLVVIIGITLSAFRSSEVYRKKKASIMWDCSVTCMEASTSEKYVINYADSKVISKTGALTIQNRNDFDIVVHLLCEGESEIVSDKIASGGCFSFYQIATDKEYTVGIHADVDLNTEVKVFVYDGEDTEPYVPDFAKKNEAVFIESDVNKGALRGTAVHRVMECLDFKGVLDINLDYEKQAYGYVVKDISRMLDEKLITDDMKKLVNPSGIKEFLMSDTGQRMAKADALGNLFREKPFVMECDGVLVQGIIDVFWIEDDKIILLDYKTDRVDSADELVTKYKTQLLYYADALSRIFSTEEKTYRADEMLIYSFRLREVIKI